MTDTSLKILSALMLKYKKSKSFREGSSSRRILIKRGEKTNLFDNHADYKTKDDFSNAVKYLSSLGLVDYKRLDNDPDALISEIWLNTDEKSICLASDLLGITPPEENLANLIDDVRSSLPKFHEDSKIAAFLCKTADDAEKTRHFPIQLFSETDRCHNQKLILALSELEKTGDGEMLEYRFSLIVFHDTKYFREHIRSNLLSVLKRIHIDEDRSDAELLELYHIVQTPEHFEFMGRIIFIMDDGTQLDFSDFKNGAVINTETVRHICSSKINSNRIISYENYTNYLSAITKPDAETLYIYHGGWASPVKKRLLEKISASITNQKVFHWGDIDKGGFDIFLDMKKLFPCIIPLHMDVETLIRYENKALPLDNERYIKRLSQLLENTEYSVFHEAIRYMIKKKIWLEMENLL